MSTSSTWASSWASSKFALATGAVSCAAVLYVIWTVLLLQLAQWAEARGASYPYKGGESSLRYVLTRIHDQPGAGQMLLMGASNAGESMLFELFERELPGFRVTHGAVGMARLTEIKVLLEYIERVYGRDALPEVVVLGASTRLIGNVPWNEPSPVFHAIDTYSPAFKVETSPEEGSRLVAKTSLEGLASRWRAITKELPRFRAAMARLALDAMGNDDSHLEFDDRRELRALVYSVSPSNRAAPFPEEFVRAARFIAEVGPLRALGRHLWFRFSPYLAQIHPPQSREQVIRRVSSDRMWWKDVRSWHPAEDELARRELAELAGFAEQRGTELFVVNLPEHPDVVAAYEGDLHVEYLRLLEESFGDHFLNLSDLLPAEQFNDTEHPGYAGALLVSNRVVEFIAQHRTGSL